MHTLVNLGGAVGWNKAPGDCLIERVIYDGVLNHFVHERRVPGPAVFGLVNVENLELCWEHRVSVFRI